MTEQDWAQTPAPGEDTITPAPVITRATPADAGCWADGVHGVYTGCKVVMDALAYGWRSVTHDDDVRVLQWARDGFADGEPGAVLPDTDAETLHVIWYEVIDEAETFLNENVAPDGYTFGWCDGDFMLASGESWCEWSGDACHDPEHDHTDPDA